MSNRTFHTLLVLIVLAAALHAAPGTSTGALLGTWKLDPSRSILTDQMKVEAVGPDKYNFIFSGNNVEPIVVNGTDQPGLFGTTLAVVVQDAHHWKVIRKSNGRVAIIALWELSSDGKTLTDDFTGYNKNGTTTNLHYIYQRTAGPAPDGKTSGFVATWESTTEDPHSTYELAITPYEGEGLSFTRIGGQISQNLRFDGRDYPASGDISLQGYVSSGRVIDDRTIERTDKINGKILRTQRIVLSPDGRVLTMTIRTPGRDKPDLMVFDRE